MKCLAFDLATKMGWAAGDLLAQPIFGSENLGEAGPKHGARFLQTLIVVQRLVNDHRPKLIAIEEAIPAGPKGGKERSQMANGYRAIVHLVAFRVGVKVEEYHVGTIRKHFIGKGNIGGTRAKAMTMEQCMDHGWDVEDDNQADALAVWAYAGEKNGMRRNKHFGGLF